MSLEILGAALILGWLVGSMLMARMIQRGGK